MHEAMARTDYAWALKKQGRATGAKVQIEEAKKLHERLGNRLQVERLDALLGKINEPI